MGESKNILILSDPHYASEAEAARANYELGGIEQPMVRLLVRIWRGMIWLREPFGHNYHLDDLLADREEHDLVVANGDFSCDSGFIGLADTAAFESARICLEKLRGRYGGRLRTVIGDHELGKSTLAGNRGGMRLASWEATTERLKVTPVWEERVGRFVLIGVTSSLIALEAFEKDILPEELAEWERLRAEHLRAVREIFARVKPEERIILFCHDPTALPYLAAEDFVQKRLPQIERTVIGHLHTPLVFWKARLLAGFPPISFMGRGIRRISGGLNRARKWKPFRVLLCPSLAGSQLLKDGGYYTLRVGEGAEFKRHRLPWR